MTAKPATSTDKKQPRQRADWEAIERDYRTGKFSDQELHTKHAHDKTGKPFITRQAISKKAKDKGWTKDLTAAVRQATRAKVIQAQSVADRKRVAGEVAERVGATSETDATLTAVLAVAEVNKQVIMGHRSDLTELRTLTMNMLRELRAVSISPDRVQALHEILTAGDAMTEDQVSEARDAFADLTRLPSRVLTIQRISQAMGRLQAMERIAFSLDEPEDPAGADAIPTSLTDAQRASRLAYILQGMGDQEVTDVG